MQTSRPKVGWKEQRYFRPGFDSSVKRPSLTSSELECNPNRCHVIHLIQKRLSSELLHCALRIAV